MKRPVLSTGLLTAIAIGATLALLPSLVGMVLLACKDTFHHDEFLPGFLIQGAGALTMLICFIVALFKAKKYDISKSGIIILIIASFIGLAANVLFAGITGDHAPRLGLGEFKFEVATTVFAFIVISPLMAIGCFQLSKLFTRFLNWGVSFVILSAAIIGFYAVWGLGDGKEFLSIENINLRGLYLFEAYSPDGDIIEHQAYSATEMDRSGAQIEYLTDDYNERGCYTSLYSIQIVKRDTALATFGGLGIALLYTITGAWGLLSMKPKKRMLDARLRNSAAKLPPAQSVDVVAAVNTPDTDNSRYMPHGTIPVAQSSVQEQPTPAPAPTAPQQEVTEDVMDQLKRLDNPRLKEIVDRPAFYNPAIVESARELLNRRKAWEQICDKPDSELLDITMNTYGSYQPDIVEAASMELYQRDSQLLYNRFSSLTPDIIAAIANGTAPAPEGIRLAAQKYLSKHRRP